MIRDDSAQEFIPRYTQQAINRLSGHLPKDFNLTAFDVLAMQNVCVYEYTSLGGSSFCSLFTEQEWKDFAYNFDVQYYGDYAYGSPTGRAPCRWMDWRAVDSLAMGSAQSRDSCQVSQR